MATRDAAADWSCLLKTIWARRLAAIADRDGGVPELKEAWSAAIAEAWQRRWEIDGIVPLRTDPHGHQWAVVASRGAPTADMVLIHGATPLEALTRTPLALAAVTPDAQAAR